MYSKFIRKHYMPYFLIADVVIYTTIAYIVYLIIK